MSPRTFGGLGCLTRLNGADEYVVRAKGTTQ
jgi:hypothetical protein